MRLDERPPAPEGQEADLLPRRQSCRREQVIRNQDDHFQVLRLTLRVIRVDRVRDQAFGWKFLWK